MSSHVYLLNLSSTSRSLVNDDYAALRMADVSQNPIVFAFDSICCLYQVLVVSVHVMNVPTHHCVETCYYTSI